jgi:hypothetical protein
MVMRSSNGLNNNNTMIAGPFRLSTYPTSPTDAACRHTNNARLCDPDRVLWESTKFPLADQLESRNVTLRQRKNLGTVVPVQYGVAVMKKVSLLLCLPRVFNFSF